mmetsp:Transcript_41552/g.88534  ORF Transcript_41552/g.88534 Transcript_41552/m.88534 type:complete len:409 (+) Transcript_41552:175-1401(+)
MAHRSACCPGGHEYLLIFFSRFPPASYLTRSIRRRLRRRRRRRRARLRGPYRFRRSLHVRIRRVHPQADGRQHPPRHLLPAQRLLLVQQALDDARYQDSEDKREPLSDRPGVLDDQPHQYASRAVREYRDEGQRVPLREETPFPDLPPVVARGEGCQEEKERRGAQLHREEEGVAISRLERLLGDGPRQAGEEGGRHDGKDPVREVPGGEGRVAVRVVALDARPIRREEYPAVHGQNSLHDQRRRQEQEKGEHLQRRLFLSHDQVTAERRRQRFGLVEDVVRDGVEVLVGEEGAHVLDEVDRRREERQAEPGHWGPSLGDVAPAGLPQADARDADDQLHRLLHEHDRAPDDGPRRELPGHDGLYAELDREEGHGDDRPVGESSARSVRGFGHGVRCSCMILCDDARDV